MYGSAPERSHFTEPSRDGESGLLRFLSGHSPFRNTHPEACRDIASHAIHRFVRKGGVVISQDSSNDTLFIVRRGLVKLVIYGEDGQAITIAMLRRGDFFGETSVLDGGRCDLTAVAVEDSTLLSLGRETVFDHFEHYPETALSFAVALCQRMRVRTNIVAGLALQDVEARLVGTLVELAEPAERDLLGVVRRLPNHQELADMVGSRRETVSRVLGSMTRRRLIQKRGRGLVLSLRLDPTVRSGPILGGSGILGTSNQ